MPPEEQVCVIYAGVRGFLDKLLTSEIYKFEQKYLAYLRENYPKMLQEIRRLKKKKLNLFKIKL